jgi:hypothetical protein
MHVTLTGGRRARRSMPLVFLFSLFLSLALPLTTSAHLKGEPSAIEEYEDAGVLADGEYESPQFGYSVEWSDAWQLDPDYDPPVESDEDEKRDDIKLAWFGDDGEQAFANVIGRPADSNTVESEFEFLIDSENAADLWGDDLEPVVLMEDLGRGSAAVLFALVESDDDDKPSEAGLDVYITLFVMVELEDDAFLIITLSGDVSHFAAAYEAAEDILVAGDEMLTPFLAGDVEDTLDQAMELSSPDAASDSELEELGLVAEDAYESPQFGYAVEWSSEWELDEYYAVPLVSDSEAGIDQLFLAWQGEQTDPDEASYVMVSGQEDGDGVDDTLDLWTSEEYAKEMWGGEADAEVILNETDDDTGVVLYSLVSVDTEEQYYKVMVVAERDGGEVLNLTLNTYGPDFESAYEAAGEILVDGEPLLMTTVSWGDIEEAIEDAA